MINNGTTSDTSVWVYILSFFPGFLNFFLTVEDGRWVAVKGAQSGLWGQSVTLIEFHL